MSRHAAIGRAVGIALAAASFVGPAAATAGNAGTVKSPYAKWQKGPSTDPAFFPLCVWLQSPHNAEKYKALGINVFVGLWDGPIEDQLAALKKAGMLVACDQNAVGLKHLDDPTIIAWIRGDEPDNAQPFKAFWKSDVEKIKKAWPQIEAFKDLGPNKPYTGYGPPIPWDWTVRECEKIKAKDPSRPLLLNLGQGVANDNYIGRGERRNQLDDYPKYMKACDIVSFDIYPACHDEEAIRDSLWYVPKGVDRLHKWGGPGKTVWNCIEAARHGKLRVSPHQLRAEVWMSLIHGSQGLIYFCHQFEPKFIEAGLLAEPDLAGAVGRVNKEILGLAPVLNSPTVEGRATVNSSDPEAPIDILVKQSGPAVYVFAVSMRDKPATGEFAVKQAPPGASIEVIGEARTLEVKDGKFSDAFNGYDVHLYRVGGTK